MGTVKGKNKKERIDNVDINFLKANLISHTGTLIIILRERNKRETSRYQSTFSKRYKRYLSSSLTLPLSLSLSFISLSPGFYLLLYVSISFSFFLSLSLSLSISLSPSLFLSFSLSLLSLLLICFNYFNILLPSIFLFLLLFLMKNEGKNHREFSSARQQDASEYFMHFLETMSRAENASLKKFDG